MTTPEDTTPPPTGGGSSDDRSSVPASGDLVAPDGADHPELKLQPDSEVEPDSRPGEPAEPGLDSAGQPTVFAPSASAPTGETEPPGDSSSPTAAEVRDPAPTVGGAEARDEVTAAEDSERVGASPPDSEVVEAVASAAEPELDVAPPSEAPAVPELEPEGGVEAREVSDPQPDPEARGASDDEAEPEARPESEAEADAESSSDGVATAESEPGSSSREAAEPEPELDEAAVPTTSEAAATGGSQPSVEDPIRRAGPETPADADAPSDSPGGGVESGRPAASPEPSSPEPSANPLPSMLGAGFENRSWLLELPEFEGPLDLLLHLVRRHELDILDIPISFVTEKYLEYLAFMQAMDLEVAGDYLVMAATLAYLKSRELVPTEPSEEEDNPLSDADGPDPREELIARLLEYQKYRAAASDLDSLPISGRDVFGRGGEIELPPVDPGLAPLTLFRLAEAYHRVLDRARIHKSHDVVMETCSVAQRMQQLTKMVVEQSKVEFEALFLGRTWSSEAELRSMLVVTLMSVLELTKLGVIFVHQEIGGTAIVIERKATPEEAKRAIAGYDEQSSFGAPKPGVAEEAVSGEAAGSPEAPSAINAPREDAESNSDA